MIVFLIFKLGLIGVFKNNFGLDLVCRVFLGFIFDIYEWYFIIEDLRKFMLFF